MTAIKALARAADEILGKVVGSPVPLDPGNGGRSIGEDALQVADIIVSTTQQRVSLGIRLGSGAEVSHAILYIGGGRVIESIASGVVERSLTEALSDASLAVALRHPRLTPERALHVRDVAGRMIGRRYDWVGVVRRALFQLYPETICSRFPADSPERAACLRWIGEVYLSRDEEQRFYCSELVAVAYAEAGMSLMTMHPNMVAPGDLQELRLSLLLAYVGHLKTHV